MAITNEGRRYDTGKARYPCHLKLISWTVQDDSVRTFNIRTRVFKFSYYIVVRVFEILQ